MADLTQTAANVGLTDDANSTTSIAAVVAGEAITQGMPVYVSGSSYFQTDADVSSVTAVAAGIALTPAAIGETFVLAQNGTAVDVGATLTVGATYVVSATKGKIAPIADLTSGDYVTILGVAAAADTLVLDINVTGVATP